MVSPTRQKSETLVYSSQKPPKNESSESKIFFPTPLDNKGKSGEDFFNKIDEQDSLEYTENTVDEKLDPHHTAEEEASFHAPSVQKKENIPFTTPERIFPNKRKWEYTPIKFSKLDGTAQLNLSEKSVKGGQGKIIFGELVDQSGESSHIALKISNKADSEFAIATEALSEHIVKMQKADVGTYSGNLMPKANGDLSKYIKKISRFIANSNEKTSLKVAFIINFSLQILDGLKKLHTKADVAHCDLKPMNILVYPTFRLVLADFGSAFKPSHSKMLPTGITPTNAAPEAMIESAYTSFGKECLDLFTTSADLWSFGTIAYQAIFGDEYFFYYINKIPSFKRDNRGKINEYLKIHSKIFEDHLISRVAKFESPLKEVVLEVISKTLIIDPRDRIRIGDLQDYLTNEWNKIALTEESEADVYAKIKAIWANFETK